MNENLESGDPISSLPVTDEVPTQDDIQLIQSVFKTNEKEVITIIDDLKEPIIICVVVVILSLPYFNTLINTYIPSFGSETYLGTLVKGIIVGLILWILRLRTKR